MPERKSSFLLAGYECKKIRYVFRIFAPQEVNISSYDATSFLYLNRCGETSPRRFFLFSS
jgi:hypothetical protein